MELVFDFWNDGMTAEAPRVLDPRSCEVRALDESLATAKSMEMEMYIYKLFLGWDVNLD